MSDGSSAASELRLLLIDESHVFFTPTQRTLFFSSGGEAKIASSSLEVSEGG